MTLQALLEKQAKRVNDLSTALDKAEPGTKKRRHLNALYCEARRALWAIEAVEIAK